VTNSFDGVGLLLVLCLLFSYKDRLSPSCTHDNFYAFFDRTTAAVYARFEFVFELNLESLRIANPKELGPIDIRPHYVTRRYGEFTASVSTLYGPLPDVYRDALTECMTKLRVVMATLLLRMVEGLKHDKKDRAIFLINNYDLILSILHERAEGALEVAYFTGLQQQCIDQFVNDQLSQFNYYYTIISFVRDIGPLVDAATAQDSMTTFDDIKHPKFSQDVVEALLKEFSMNWRSGINTINATVTKLFPNFKTGMALFQKIFETIFSYYKQFSNIIMRCFKQLRSSRYFVSETEILHEMRKYYVTFD